MEPKKPSRKKTFFGKVKNGVWVEIQPRETQKKVYNGVQRGYRSKPVSTSKEGSFGSKKNRGGPPGLNRPSDHSSRGTNEDRGQRGAALQGGRTRNPDPLARRGREVGKKTPESRQRLARATQPIGAEMGDGAYARG